MPLSDIPFDTRRDAVVAFIRSHFSEENTGETLQNLHAFEVRMIDLGLKNVVPALRVLLDDESSHVRVFAAWWMLTLRLGAPRDVRPDQAEKAEEVLVNVLKDPDVEKRLWPLILLTATGFESMRSAMVPKAAEPIILEMLQDSDERFSIPAAAVCVRFLSENEVLEAVRILVKGIDNENPTLAMIAAGAFGNKKIQTSRVANELASMLNVDNPNLLLPVVMSIKSMAENAETAIDPLLKVLRDRKVEPALRGACASALVEICQTAPDVELNQKEQIRLALEAMVRSGSWPVMWAAVAGLKQLNLLKAELTRSFVPSLESEFEDERLQAALLLSEFGHGLSRLTQTLLSRLIVEESQEVCRALVKALVAIGKEAVPDLVKELKTDRPNTLPHVAEALVQIGSEAVPEVAETLLSDEDERVREFGVAILQRLGSRAAAAVPDARKLLVNEKAEIREHAAMSLVFMGPLALPAIPELIAALSDPLLDVAHWAKKAICVIGAEVVPFLLEARKNAQGSAQVSVTELLNYFGTSQKGALSEGFEWVGDDNRLVLFAWVGHSLNQSPDSIRNLAKRLEELLTSGVWRHSLPTVESTLRSNLNALEAKLSRGLKTKIKLRKSIHGKATVLTEKGQELLPKITEYLKSIGRFVELGRVPE